jgi:hypothetical protein
MSFHSAGLLVELSRRSNQLRDDARVVDVQAIRGTVYALRRLVDDSEFWQSFDDQSKPSRSFNNEAAAWTTLATDWGGILDSVGWQPPPTAQMFATVHVTHPLEAAMRRDSAGAVAAAARAGISDLVVAIEKLVGAESGPTNLRGLVYRANRVVQQSLSASVRRRLVALARLGVAAGVAVVLSELPDSQAITVAAGGSLNFASGEVSDWIKRLGSTNQPSIEAAKSLTEVANEIGRKTSRAAALAEDSQPLDVLVGFAAMKLLGPLAIVPRRPDTLRLADSIGLSLFYARVEPENATSHLTDVARSCLELAFLVDASTMTETASIESRLLEIEAAVSGLEAQAQARADAEAQQQLDRLRAELGPCSIEVGHES